MHVICTIRKLKFPYRTTAKEDGVASCTFSNLVDYEESRLVKEFTELKCSVITVFQNEYSCI